MTDLCTSSDVYAEKANVHHAYMAKKLAWQKKTAKTRSRRNAEEPEPRWRITEMRTWRKHRDLTQQQVADLLVEAGIDYDRVSIQRVEKGDQMPPIEVIEGIAKILKVDVHTMLNRKPEDAAPFEEFETMGDEARRRALRLFRAANEAG